MDFYKIGNSKQNPVIYIAYEIVRRLFMAAGKALPDKYMDDGSNKYEVKKLLRCAISNCFDKGNICCKACDIKKCRYKCNFIDNEICEHQYIE